jgi:hypothetical protein
LDEHVFFAGKRKNCIKEQQLMLVADKPLKNTPVPFSSLKNAQLTVTETTEIFALLILKECFSLYSIIYLKGWSNGSHLSLNRSSQVALISLGSFVLPQYFIAVFSRQVVVSENYGRISGHVV